MKTRLIRSGKLAGGFGLLLALTLMMLFLAVPALAFPQQPHQFYGSVTICGEPVEPGTVVTALIDGIQYPNSTTTVDADGHYGYAPLFKLPADDTDPGTTGGVDGDPVEFWVMGSLAGTFTFDIGGTTELDLEVPCGGDTTPPEVDSTSPVDDAWNVPVNTLVTATFSEPVNPATIVFSLNSVVGSLTYAGTTATFDPDANLNYWTYYTASIQASDLAGNPMVDPYIWHFTTTQQLPPGTIALVEGANIIAYTGATADLPEALTNIGPAGLDVVDGIWARGAWTGGEWWFYNARILYGTLTQLETGQAYIIIVTQDCAWVLPLD